MVLVATQVKRRRGTTAENDAFTGAEGEITVDTEKHELRVHDGVTQGGHRLYTQNEIDSIISTIITTPTGMIISFAGSVAPEGFLICDGAAISRTLYANLFSVIGTTYGAGDGSTTFNLPNKSPERTIIETQDPTAENGYTWYRLYSDGWVEQGGTVNGVGSYGRTSINLPITMADNNYQPFANMRDLGNSWYTNNSNFPSFSATTDVAGTASNVSATGFEIQRYSYHTWYVCGKSARGASQQGIICIKY